MAMSGGVMRRRMHISRFLWLSGESWIEPQPGQTRLMDLGASRAVIWCWQRRRYRRDCWWATSSSGLRPVRWRILCARLRLVRPLLMEWWSNRGVWWVIDHVRAVYLKLDWFHEELRVNTWRKLPGHSQESNESTRNWNTVQVMTVHLCDSSMLDLVSLHASVFSWSHVEDSSWYANPQEMAAFTPCLWHRYILFCIDMHIVGIS